MEKINIYDKESIRNYFPDDEIGIEMFECVQSVPPRFRREALDVFYDIEDRIVWTMGSVDETWTCYLSEIVDEMTEEEKKEYGF